MWMIGVGVFFMVLMVLMFIQSCYYTFSKDYNKVFQKKYYKIKK
jgi:hypothetical protein